MSSFLRAVSVTAICSFLLCDTPYADAQAPALGKARVDALGDPLPEGAVARLGSARFRHGGKVTGLAFLPDGDAVISSSEDGTLRVWQVPSGRELRRFEGHTGAVCRLALSADGKLLLSGGQDQTIRLWDVTTGKQLRKLEGHTAGVIAVALSPNNGLVASGSYDGTIRLWDLDSDKALFTLKPTEGRVSYMSLAFSPNGKVLATGTRNLRLWDVATGKQQREWQGHMDGHVFSLIFHDGGKKLISGGHDGAVRVWDATTGAELKQFGRNPFGGSDGLGGGVAVTPDGKTLATGNHHGNLFLLDLAEDQKPRVLSGHHRWLGPVAFSPDGKLLATGGEDRTIRLWDWKTGKELPQAPGHSAAINAVAVSPDGRKVATASGDLTVQIWEADTGKRLHVLEGHRDHLTSVDFSPNGKLLASSCYHDRTIRLWDAHTGKLVHELNGHTGPVYQVRFSPDGLTLATAGSEGNVRLWDSGTGTQVGRLDCEGPAGFTRVCWSPDGKYLAGGCYERMIYLWQMPGHKEVQRFVGHDRIVQGLVFASDSKTLVSTGNDNSVRIWDAGSGKELWSARNAWDEHGVSSVALSPDGRTLAVCGKPFGDRGRRMLLIEMATRQVRGELLDVPGWFLSMTFMPDGRRLVLGGLDSTALVWDPLLVRAKPRPDKGPEARLLEDRFARLKSMEARPAYAAMQQMTAWPKETVAHLKKHLKPVPKVDPARLQKLVADLTDERVQRTEHAELLELDEAALPVLPKLKEYSRDTAPPSIVRLVKPLVERLESPTPTPEKLQAIRAVEVLEQIGTPAARELLADLGKGAPEATLTREATASLERLRKRGLDHGKDR